MTGSMSIFFIHYRLIFIHYRHFFVHHCHLFIHDCPPFHLQVCAKGRKSSANRRAGGSEGQRRLRRSTPAAKSRGSAFGFVQEAFGRAVKVRRQALVRGSQSPTRCPPARWFLFRAKGCWRQLTPKLSIGEGSAEFPLDKKTITCLLYACSERAYD